MYIKIRKSGTFYSVFDDDCYVLYYLFGYNIKHSKTGFPKSALNKVINCLEENKINYEVVGEDIKGNFKTLNKYNKFYKLGLNKYEHDIHYEDIMGKLMNASEDKLDRILETIEVILDE